MAIGVVTFELCSRDSDVIKYRVTSPDFSSVPGQEAALGTLTVLLRERTCKFEPGGALSGMQVVPPELFLRMSAEEIQEKVREGSVGGEAMPWMRRIGITVQYLFRRGDFPDRYP